MGRLLLKMRIAPPNNFFAKHVLRYQGWVTQPQKWIPFLQILTDAFPALLQDRGSDGRTVIETLYFNAISSPNEAALFSALAPGALPLASTITSDMEMRILSNEERMWLPFLPASRKAACEKLLDAPPTPLRDSILLLETLALTLRTELMLHNLAPESMNAHLIVQAHTEKKRIKALLKSTSASTEKQDLQATYDKFVRLYDQVVSLHPIFREVRAFSHTCRVMQAGELPKLPLLKFLDLWTEKPDPGKWRGESLLVRKKIAQAVAEVQPLPQKLRFLTLVHGTHSAALPLILKMGSKLLASGKLFSAGVAPLTGEGTSAIGGNNVTGISAMPPDSSWNQPQAIWTEQFAKRSSRFLISERYATGINSFGSQNAVRPLLFNPEKEYETVHAACTALLSSSPATDSYFWFDFKRSILRLKQTENALFMQRMESQLKALQAAFAKLPTTENLHRKQFAGCLEVWQQDPKVELDPKDPMIANELPLLFAASSFGIEPYSEHWHRLRGIDEVLVEQDLTLGQDLDLVFTSNEALPLVKKAVSKLPLHVLSLNAGRYLQMRNMALGSVERGSFMKGNTLSTRLFHSDILPYYATLLSERPSYLHAHEKPFFGFEFGADFAKYKKAVESKAAPSRSIHGAMHACRVALFSLMLKNIYASKNKPVEVSLQQLLSTAGLHDAAREDEGIDRTDPVSAKMARHYVRDCIFNGHQDKIPKGLLETIEQAILHKDELPYKTVLQRIVSDADRFDIVRVLKDPKKEFRLDEVALMTVPEFRDFPIAKLMEEIIEFVQETEKPALKLYLEHNSQDYLFDLALIFNDLHKKRNRFPIMESFLRMDMGQLLVRQTKEAVAKITRPI